VCDAGGLSELGQDDDRRDVHRRGVVRADTAGAILKIKFQEYSGTTLVGSVSSQITLSTSWQQVSVPYTIKSPGSTLDLRLYVANPAPGTAFHADDISLFVS